MWRANIKKGVVWKEVYALSSLYMYDLAPLNKHPTDDLTYLSRHIPISVVVHDTLSKEHVYWVDENPEGLIERFIEVLVEKQEAIVTDALKQHPYPSDFQKGRAMEENERTMKAMG